MGDQFRVPERFRVPKSVSYFLSATLKDREWFWGVVLTLLLIIGCVESNPGPRSNEEITPQTEQPRRQYGSIENRHGRQWSRKEMPAVSSVCWPFIWWGWCRSEPLPDEESLLGNRIWQRPVRGSKDESEDDDLLVDIHLEPLSSDEQRSELELEIDILKQKVELLKGELEREVKQREEGWREYNESIVKLRKEEEKSRRIHEELRAELDEALLQNTLLEQQLQEAKHKDYQSHTEEEIDKFNKEFQRRKQLEEELDKQVQERKEITITLQEEILKRQKLEQDMRLHKLNSEAERKEQHEQNQEQEIQRRQLQHAMELEAQKRQELLQQLNHEMKQRQKETQQRHELEKQLQEEIQVRHDLELEFKQADLQGQILEQELRQQLKELHVLLNRQDSEDTEVTSINDKKETRSTECCAGHNNNDESHIKEMFDKDEQSEDGGDDDEKHEIRLLLQEEFKRLQPQKVQRRLSKKSMTDKNGDICSNIYPDTKNSAASEYADQIGKVPVQKPDHGNDAIETEFGAVKTRNLLQKELEEDAPGKADLNYNSGDEGTKVRSRRYIGREDENKVSGVIRREVRDVFTEGSGQRRKGILLRRGLSLGLEHLWKEHSTVDFGSIKEDNVSQKSNYSDILGKIANFQGQDVTVASLIGEAILPETEVLLEEFNKALSNGNKPVIGCTYARNVGYYVPRTLQRKVFVRNDIFKHRTSKLPNVFAISGMSKEELQEIVLPGESIFQFNESSGIENASPKYILLNDLTAEHDYNDLCKRLWNFKTIHWLSKHPDGLEWKKSKGNIDIIHQYIALDKSKNILSLTDMKDETVILSGNSGEGKSTYLTNFQSEINVTFPATWIIRLNLSEHLDDIEKCNLTETRVIELLSSAAGLETSLEKALLKYSLQITRNVAVLVDEIGFYHRRSIHKLLIILKNMNTKNLVIAAHTCMTTSIENALSTLAFTLQPLSKKELQMLMTKFWKTDLGYTDDKVADEFSAALLHLIENSLGKGNSPTPLDIEMLAHIFEKDFTTSLTSKFIHLPQCFDVIELYEKYIIWKFEMGNNGDADIVSYLADITYSSMLSVFPEEIVTELISLKALQETRSKFKGQLPFLHRSLQDYVTAKWFAENYQRYRSFIQEKYFEVELQTMWSIYDRILAKRCELHTSVLYEDVHRIRGLLSNGYDVNSLDTGGRTALHLAVIQAKYFANGDPKGDDQCVQIASLLLDHNADVSITDSVLKWTALRYADMIGSWSIIDRILQGTADISDMAYTKQRLLNRTFLHETLTNAAVNGLTHVTKYILDTGLDINTPLHSTKYSHQQYGLVHIASENGHVSLLKFLLENGSDVNVCNWENSTPLHLACKQGRKDCVLILLERHARIDQSNKKGDTPLHEAVRSGHCDIVQSLLSRNADMNLFNKYGDTPLHVACQGNHLKTVSFLMDRKAYNNILNKNGDSPLDCAIRGGYTALVKYILSRVKGKCMDQGRDGRKPVHLAAVTGDVLMLDYLLQVMPEVNASTAGGDTPLHLASLHGNAEAVVFLLKRGAENNKGNNHGNTPLHLASVRGNVDTLNALLEHNAQINVYNVEGNTPLHLACLQGKADAVRCLIKYHADVNTKNREKNTPLHLAATKGSLEVIRILIEANSDVNIANRYGDTILHQCAGNGRLDIVELLLQTGRCHVDARDSKGDTSLVTATRSGFANIVECLALSGADINFLTHDGNAPVHIAVMSGNVELVNKLGELGANLNIGNHQGNTPLHRALYSGNEVMVRHLVELGVHRNVRNKAGHTPFDLAVHLGSNDSILNIL